MTELYGLYYDAFDIACIIYSQDLGVKTAGDLLGKICKEDRQFLVLYYRNNFKALYLDVYYWLDYLCDKPAIDKEFPSIQKDFSAFGKEIEEAEFITDYFDVDLFFKTKRLQILYFGEQDYVRMKLRTLLKAYGYKRRTQEFLKYLRECLLFYHMQTYLRGGEECDIGIINLDDMITIRVV